MGTKNKMFSTKSLVMLALMIAITMILAFTPLGMIRLPVVSITIAHVPAIISAIVLGLYEGMAIALAFGLCSLFLAITAPASILDPFFVNPLISILPRVLIAVTTYFSYRGLSKGLRRFKRGEYLAVATSVVIGNLTNTFGVYTMLYLVYAKQIFEKSGKSALTLIIGAISTTTIIKCIGIVIVAVPIVYALNRIKKHTA